MALLFGVNVGDVAESRRNVPYCSREGYNSNKIWIEMLSSQVSKYGLIALTHYGQEPDSLKGDGVFDPSKVHVGIVFHTEPRNSADVIKNLKDLTDALANPIEVQKKLRQAGLNAELSEICLYVL